MSILEYVVRGEYAWLVQIVFLLTIGVPLCVYVGNLQAFRSKRMELEFAADEASEKRRMEELVLDHKKPDASKEVAVIDHETGRRRR